jgi:uncharacterized protein
MAAIDPRPPWEPDTTPDPAADPLAPAPTGVEAPGEPTGDEPPPPRAEPVSESQRLGAVDTLRGFALLGILAMNIASFGWPFSGYDNPVYSGGAFPANNASWMASHVLFSGKMMSLFSMLFGAGLVLMSNRAANRGATIAGVYYRRVLWLMAFGLIHGYFIWSGDILFAYSLCGLVLFFFRRLGPRWLIGLGVALILVSTAVWPLLGLGVNFMKGMAADAVAEQAAGGELEPGQAEMVETWEEMQAMFAPTEEMFAEQLDAFRGSYFEVFPHRARETFEFQAMYLPLFIWGIAGRMLLGMGLMKLGVFAGVRSTRFYVIMAIACYAIGLPPTILGGIDYWRSGFDAIRGIAIVSSLGLLGTVPVALGHAAVLMLVLKSGLLRGLTDRLAAVGRMALTNYLMQSLICTTIFYGYGLGYFGTIARPGLWLVVVAIWALQLWYSPRWLSRYRFGPMEWVWRSLTYGKPQPMRA